MYKITLELYDGGMGLHNTRISWFMKDDYEIEKLAEYLYECFDIKSGFDKILIEKIKPQSTEQIKRKLRKEFPNVCK